MSEFEPTIQTGLPLRPPFCLYWNSAVDREQEVVVELTPATDISLVPERFNTIESEQDCACE